MLNKCEYFFQNGKYHLFFHTVMGMTSERTKIIVIGLDMQANDLVNWMRDDSLAGINVSEHGWDSKMIAYPHIFSLCNQIHMLYCGNDFGKSGFGWATLTNQSTV